MKTKTNIKKNNRVRFSTKKSKIKNRFFEKKTKKNTDLAGREKNKYNSEKIR
jgi:hypothetical protein